MGNSSTGSGDRLDALYTYLNTISLNVGMASIQTAKLVTSPNVGTSSVLLIAANPLRKGLWLYNNSANSVYVAISSPANSATNMSFILATFANWMMPAPIYTGALYGIRNAGTGICLITEFT